MKRIKDQSSKLGKDFFFVLYFLGGCQGVGEGWFERRGESRGEGERGEKGLV